MKKDTSRYGTLSVAVEFKRYGEMQRFSDEKFTADLTRCVLETSQGL